MIKVRFHGRGGQGMKTSSRILGTAAFLSGLYAQDFPIYGAERRGAPVVAFTVISEEPILERGYIFDPDILLISDETLLLDKQTDPTKGVSKESIVFINSSKNKKHFEERIGKKVIVEDLTQIALETLGRPILSTLIAGVATKLVGIKQKYLEEAVKEELEQIGISEEIIRKNVLAATVGYNKVQEVKIEKIRSLEPEVKVVEIEYDNPEISTPVISFVANSYLKKTGTWRVFKPVINYQKCKSCRLCYVYCPESAIKWENNFPVVDYENCKGCLICAQECPLKAIETTREGE
ncbi:2-oxoacid:acceptor oxidoreductase family protein [archaeon]|jgi:pyruvate ferredoxin oxidoreductase gamma subunit|nr:2-oxoacid:acceptor oxidoreductase family protein [archaeon]NHV05990.1 4Fe-4S binding protein [Nitrososphaerota archaeon]